MTRHDEGQVGGKDRHGNMATRRMIAHDRIPAIGRRKALHQLENKMNIKDMVKDKKVTFLYYRENELWYTTECGFEFPVPINDVGTGYMNAQDKAILYMRWIRKHIALIDGAKAET